MANKKDKVGKEDDVHVFLAVRRTKDNDNQTAKDEICHRMIARVSENGAVNINPLKGMLEPGVWRIYRTVNSRDPRKAARLLQHELLDNFDEWYYRIDSLYKKMLLQPTCRKTKNFMFDIDTKDVSVIDELLASLSALEVETISMVESPSGFHLITKPFNLQEITLPEEVTILTDGYYFIEKITV
jgi:hypothetical protein